MSGVIETEAPEHLMVYRSNLNLAEKMLRENDIVGVIEPINKYSLPNYFLNDYKKGWYLLCHFCNTDKKCHNSIVQNFHCSNFHHQRN